MNKLYLNLHFMMISFWGMAIDFGGMCFQRYGGETNAYFYLFNVRKNLIFSQDQFPLFEFDYHGRVVSITALFFFEVYFGNGKFGVHINRGSLR